jgi:hypothetical protein
VEAARLPAQRAVEFGIYRDGDNNLDRSQAATLAQAVQTSAKDHRVEYTVEDTTSIGTGKLRTDAFTIADGGVGQAQVEPPHDMASEPNLARFVDRVLDNAQSSGATQTWIELTDHGAGDGGGLQADRSGHIMPMPKIAQAIADGVRMHAQEHPEDAQRGIDGVVANQCLMASLGFADALYHAGVHYLAASPETMVSPGVPSNVADAIAKHPSDSAAFARGIVSDVMRQNYGVERTWKPAAAFDVLDLNGGKMAKVEASIKGVNDAISAAGSNHGEVTAIREDARAIDGMVRFSDATPDMPWHSDRPAIALYDTLASDGRLDPVLRAAAKDASSAVSDIVTAHRESSSFKPFGGSDYTDAVGPTVHFPVKASQIDPWAPRVSETRNRFFRETDAAAAERVVA